MRAKKMNCWKELENFKPESIGYYVCWICEEINVNSYGSTSYPKILNWNGEVFCNKYSTGLVDYYPIIEKVDNEIYQLHKVTHWIEQPIKV